MLVIHEMFSVKPSACSFRVILAVIIDCSHSYRRPDCWNALANPICPRHMITTQQRFYVFHGPSLQIREHGRRSCRHRSPNPNRKMRLALLSACQSPPRARISRGYKTRTLATMPSTKRQSDSNGEVSLSKKLKTGKENKTDPNIYGRIASLDNATAANKNPPVAQLQNALESVKAPDTVDPGACVVYWMRMEDLRSMSSIYRFRLT